MFSCGKAANTVSGAQTSIVQSLTYFEHLSDPMAEFLHILAEQYDYPQLADEILRYAFLLSLRTGLVSNSVVGRLEIRSSIQTIPRARDQCPLLL